ncbi:MAG TPA: hypothetical protein PKN04_08055 [bacterium]|nr:hypothetical protein [bacterium]HNT65712.1 hypothetical protein [bacterium]HOX84871.1 hypothetical protein [bacterium]HPG44263.1 hypothetical protein [bacterium]HPM96630.1 hypothetical protein [bacterium]
MQQIFNNGLELNGLHHAFMAPIEPVFQGKGFAMRTHLFRLSLLSLACFALLTIFASSIDPLLARWGDPSEVHSLLASIFLVIGVISVALIFVRTVIGLVLTVFLAAAVFYLAYHYLGVLIGG